MGEERRYVVGLVEDALVEVGPAGGEEGVGCDGFAIEEGLIGTERGDGETCGADGGTDAEVFAQERGAGGDAVGAGDGLLAVGPGAEGRGERAGNLRGGPWGVGSGSGLPLGVGDDAVLLAVGARDADGGGDGGGCGGGGCVGFVGGDVEENFVVAGVEEGGDLFAVKGSPLVVMAGEGAVDAGGEVAANEDVEAGGDRRCVKMDAVAELRGSGGGDAERIGVGEPDVADGGEFLRVGEIVTGNPLGFPVGGAHEAGFK